MLLDGRCRMSVYGGERRHFSEENVFILVTKKEWRFVDGWNR